MAQKSLFQKSLSLEKETLLQLTDQQTQQVAGAGGTRTHGESPSCYGTLYHPCLSVEVC